MRMVASLMAIKVLPSKILKKIAPAKKIEKLITKKLTLNRTVLSLLSDNGVVSKKALERVALNVIQDYKESYGNFVDDGLSKSDALEEAVNDKKLMVQRVQNSIVNKITQDVKDTYDGEFYEWLPSDADTPDPLHQLNYGKKFRLGFGEAPGDRYGCRCGMNILVDETELAV